MNASKLVAWLMLAGGAIGAVLALFGVIFPHEPPGLTQLSWGAIWSTGLVGIIAAQEGASLSDEDIDRIARRMDDIYWGRA